MVLGSRSMRTAWPRSECWWPWMQTSGSMCRSWKMDIGPPCTGPLEHQWGTSPLRMTAQPLRKWSTMIQNCWKCFWVASSAYNFVFVFVVWLYCYFLFFVWMACCSLRLLRRDLILNNLFRSYVIKEGIDCLHFSLGHEVSNAIRFLHPRARLWNSFCSSWRWQKNECSQFDPTLTFTRFL